MTRHASRPGDDKKVREGRRMARSLRNQAHDEGHERITKQVRRDHHRRPEPESASSGWSPLPTT